MTAPVSAMRYVRTQDSALVRKIMITPKLWKHSTDDGCPKPEDFDVTIHEVLWYVLAYEGEELIGCFFIHPENSTTWQFHTFILPDAWGKSEEALRGLFEWVWENHKKCMRLVTRVPVYNRLAIQLARKIGTIGYGQDKMSFQKNGQFWDEALFGISRPGVK